MELFFILGVGYFALFFVLLVVFCVCNNSSKKEKAPIDEHVSNTVLFLFFLLLTIENSTEIAILTYLIQSLADYWIEKTVFLESGATVCNFFIFDKQTKNVHKKNKKKTLK